jgi:hypothetical protein
MRSSLVEQLRKGVRQGAPAKTCISQKAMNWVGGSGSKRFPNRAQNILKRYTFARQTWREYEQTTPICVQNSEVFGFADPQ